MPLLLPVCRRFRPDRNQHPQFDYLNFLCSKFTTGERARESVGARLAPTKRTPARSLLLLSSSSGTPSQSQTRSVVIYYGRNQLLLCPIELDWTTPARVELACEPARGRRATEIALDKARPIRWRHCAGACRPLVVVVVLGRHRALSDPIINLLAS